MADYQDIAVERVESWIEITLKREDKLNALRARTAEEIMSVIGSAEEDPEIGLIILQGAGKAFCTGIDTSEFQVKEGEYFDFYRRRRRSWKVAAMFRELPHVTKPVIAVVEGYALGGGFELALLSDMIVAGKKAMFGLPETRLGIMPGGGGTQTLPRIIGRPLAKELMWTGRRLSADEALAYRLVNHVAPQGEALEKARELARSICESAPLAIMMSKTAVDRGVDATLADGMAQEGDLAYLLYFSEDRNEGLSAFREKRQARFRGK
ncbi:MAG: enoyl-CoA hydratase/isomerase family protein [Aquisalimonadaceae bacterium]